jgi:hypothetical protein
MTTRDKISLASQRALADKSEDKKVKFFDTFINHYYGKYL